MCSTTITVCQTQWQRKNKTKNPFNIVCSFLQLHYIWIHHGKSVMLRLKQHVKCGNYMWVCHLTWLFIKLHCSCTLKKLASIFAVKRHLIFLLARSLLHNDWSFLSFWLNCSFNLWACLFHAVQCIYVKCQHFSSASMNQIYHSCGNTWRKCWPAHMRCTGVHNTRAAVQAGRGNDDVSPSQRVAC